MAVSPEHIMDTKIIPKTSLFDQISFLMVGAIATALIACDLYYYFSIPLPEITIGSAVLWIALAYFAGHFTQVTSNFLAQIPFLKLLRWETRLSYMEYEHEILDEMRSYIDVKDKHNERPDFIWNLCYMLAATKDPTGQIEAFAGYYNLYRGWFISFFLEALFLLYMFIAAPSRPTAIALVVSLVMAFMFYKRAHRFWQYVRDKVFGVVMLNGKSRI